MRYQYFQSQSRGNQFHRVDRRGSTMSQRRLVDLATISIGCYFASTLELKEFVEAFARKNKKLNFDFAVYL